MQYKTIDILKFVSCIMIVVLHTRPFATFDLLNYYVTCLTRVAVPFFLIVSSFLFWTYSRNIIKFVKRLLLLYAIWLVVNLPIVIINYYIEPATPWYYNTAVLLKNFLFNSTFMASWFIMALAESMLLIWFLRKKVWLPLVVGILLYLPCLSSSMYYGLLGNTSLGGFNNFISGHFPFANSFFAAVIYVALGKLLAERRAWFCKKINIAVTCVFICTAFLEVFLLKDTGWRINDCFVSLVPLSLSISVLSVKIDVKSISEKLAKKLRNVSTVVYVSHGLFIYIYWDCIGIQYGPILFLCVLISSMLLSSAVISLSDKIPVLKYAY